MRQDREATAAGGPAGVVAVWRNLWLPTSETFVRDHVASLMRWRPVTLGLSRTADGLDVRPDRAPFGRTGWRRSYGRLARRAGYPWVYRGVVARTRPSLVHAHFGTDAVDALPVARRYGLPLVVTFHGYDLSSALEGPGAARYRERLREVFDYASALLPVSQEMERRLLELGAPPEKITVHHLGIPLRAQERWERTPPGVVFVGRLIRRKGVADLVEAVSLLPQHLRGTRVTIVGDGPERARLEAQAARLGVDADFVGRQPSDVVTRLLREHSVFCGPSREVEPGDVEAFGLVFLEAALAGLPVVAYRHGGVPEAVVHDRTGLLADEGDVAGLSRHLATLLDDPEKADRLGRAGMARVQTDFDLHRRTEALELIYDTFTTSRTRGRF